MDERQVLGSWKEISSFLDRDIRTCQRWERELGLPVHRLDGSSRARVLAYRNELEDWLEKRLHEQDAEPPAAPALPACPAKRSRAIRRALVIGLVVLASAAAVFAVWRLAVRPRPPQLAADFVPPVLAILPFENRSGDATLDYWRESLAVILSVNLSQSRYVRVVPGDQILTVLRRLGLDGATVFSSEDIERIAAQTQAAHVLSGSYIKAGEAIVITAGLQEAGSGRSLDRLKAVAHDEYDVIPKVDKLARRIKKGLRFTRAQIAYDYAKEAGQAVTSSPEALKYYAEGRRHQLSNRWAEAVASMEKAIAVDPGFAMAYRSLATAHRDLFHYAQARTYIEKALELGDRLPEGEREFIEGQIAFWDEDYARAIQILEGLLKTRPGHLNAHSHLGYAYNDIGDVDKAIEHQGYVTRNRNTVLDIRYLAGYLQKKGRYREAADVCLSFLRDVEDAWSVRVMLAYCYSFMRKFDQAVAEAQNAYQANARSEGYLGEILVFNDDLAGAESLLGPGPYSLNRGRFAEYVGYARRDLEKARARGIIEEEVAAERLLAVALGKAGRWAEASLAFGEYLDLAAASRRPAPGSGPGATILPYLPSARKRDLFLKARIEAGMGAADDALKTAGELKALVASGLNPKELRYPEFILGLVELRKGDAARAVELFESAFALLDSEDFWGTEQGLFLDAYAEALRLAGNLDRARETYEKITLLTTGRREDGDIYGRAFYRLGKIAEQRGEDEAAQAYYRKFLSLWVGADPGLPEVLDAAVRLSRR